MTIAPHKMLHEKWSYAKESTWNSQESNLIFKLKIKERYSLNSKMYKERNFNQSSSSPIFLWKSVLVQSKIWIPTALVGERYAQRKEKCYDDNVFLTIHT